MIFHGTDNTNTVNGSNPFAIPDNCLWHSLINSLNGRHSSYEICTISNMFFYQPMRILHSIH